MFTAKSCILPFSCALLLVASINNSEAFTPLNSRSLARKPIHETLSASQQFQQNAQRSAVTSTSLYVNWPWKDETSESTEGKRDSTKSRLQSTAEASEAYLNSFLSDVTTTTVEEFVAPVANVLDDKTGGWALSYANLEPETETSPVGISFLATNLAYGIVGSLLMTQGNTFLGVLTELACIASFVYHYSQLKFGQEGSRIVRLSLLVDYFFALSAIAVGSGQLLLSNTMISQDAVVGGALAIASLGACWVWEEGVSYIFFHSLWHLFSAYTGYTIGSIQ